MQKLVLTAVVLLLAVPRSPAGVRIKDITELEGARSNQLAGFGLVIGLNGTGSKNSFTQQVAVDMLQRFYVAAKTVSELRGDAVFKSGNISAVIVTAELGPFVRKGSRIDVTVSALDDASSLQGGQLFWVPLKGFDNVVYAVASGEVMVSGFNFSVAGAAGAPPTASAQKNHPTVGRVVGGAIVECEARGKIMCNGQIRLVVRDADYATAKRIAQAINLIIPSAAFALDAGAVQVFVPEARQLELVDFVAEIGAIEIDPDMVARVIINERTGTVVAGENVRISTVALTHGNLAISTSNEPIASQPLPFARGKTAILPRATVGVTEEAGMVRVLGRTTTVAELARALNALGATSRDLVIIFQHLKRLGALHAELVILDR